MSSFFTPITLLWIMSSFAVVMYAAAVLLKPLRRSRRARLADLVDDPSSSNVGVRSIPSPTDPITIPTGTTVSRRREMTSGRWLSYSTLQPSFDNATISDPGHLSLMQQTTLSPAINPTRIIIAESPVPTRRWSLANDTSSLRSLTPSLTLFPSPPSPGEQPPLRSAGSTTSNPSPFLFSSLPSEVDQTTIRSTTVTLHPRWSSLEISPVPTSTSLCETLPSYRTKGTGAPPPKYERQISPTTNYFYPGSGNAHTNGKPVVAEKQALQRRHCHE